MVRAALFRSFLAWLLLTLLLPGTLPATEKFIWVVYGGNEAGVGNSVVHKKLLEQMKTENPAFILHTGNMVAEGDRPLHWEKFFSDVDGLFSKIPFRPVAGSLDVSKREYFSDFFVADGGKTYYTFTLGPAHFIALDTTRNFAPGSPQYRFLTENLQAVPVDAPLIVYFNHPPFSGSRIGGDERVEAYLVPLLEKYGVDLVLSGQEHAYQRIGPINGVYYLVTGGGGAPLFPVDPQPPIVQYKTLYHYLVFELSEGRIRGKMKDVRGVEEDSFEIPIGPPAPAGSYQEHPQLKRSKRYFHR